MSVRTTSPVDLRQTTVAVCRGAGVNPTAVEVTRTLGTSRSQKGTAATTKDLAGAATVSALSARSTSSDVVVTAAAKDTTEPAAAVTVPSRRIRSSGAPVAKSPVRAQDQVGGDARRSVVQDHAAGASNEPKANPVGRSPPTTTPAASTAPSEPTSTSSAFGSSVSTESWKSVVTRTSAIPAIGSETASALSARSSSGVVVDTAAAKGRVPPGTAVTVPSRRIRSSGAPVAKSPVRAQDQVGGDARRSVVQDHAAGASNEPKANPVGRSPPTTTPAASTTPSEPTSATKAIGWLLTTGPPRAVRTRTSAGRTTPSVSVAVTGVKGCP